MKNIVPVDLRIPQIHSGRAQRVHRRQPRHQVQASLQCGCIGEVCTRFMSTFEAISTTIPSPISESGTGTKVMVTASSLLVRLELCSNRETLPRAASQELRA